MKCRYKHHRSIYATGFSLMRFFLEGRGVIISLEFQPILDLNPFPIIYFPLPPSPNLLLNHSSGRLYICISFYFTESGFFIRRNLRAYSRTRICSPTLKLGGEGFRVGGIRLQSSGFGVR